MLFFLFAFVCKCAVLLKVYITNGLLLKIPKMTVSCISCFKIATYTNGENYSDTGMHRFHGRNPFCVRKMFVGGCYQIIIFLRLLLSIILKHKSDVTDYAILRIHPLLPHTPSLAFLPRGGGGKVERGIGDVPRNRVPFSPLL